MSWKVLAPVAVLEGEALPRGIVEFLRPAEVVVLGYYVVPEQTAPGQARMQFEDRAEAALDEVVGEIETAGGRAERRLVFTAEREQSFDRVAAETGCEALLLSSPVAAVESVLVAFRGGENVDRVTDLVATLVADRDIGVELYHAADSEAAADEGRDLLSRAAEALVDGGVAADDLDQRVAVTDAPLQGVIDAAASHDLVVTGESEPSLETFVFGEFPQRLADQSLDPVLVVKGPGSASEK